MNLKIARLSVATIAIAAFVTGCATATTSSNSDTQQQVISEKLDSYIFEDGSVRVDVSDRNIARLWQEYSIMRRAGNLDSARAKLEEAISIAPNHPALWSGAAEVELDANSHLRAENYAAKSNFLAAIGDRSLRYRNWLIIQRAREGRGDLLGARQAQIESTNLAQ